VVSALSCRSVARWRITVEEFKLNIFSAHIIFRMFIVFREHNESQNPCAVVKEVMQIPHLVLKLRFAMQGEENANGPTHFFCSIDMSL